MDTKKIAGVKETSARHFDRLANNYASSYAGKHSKTLYNGVLEKILIFPHQAILDVGCGTGNLLSMVPRETGTKLYGIDLSPEMVKLARAKLGPEVELKTGDSEHLPWAAGFFDLVYSTDSFHHYPQPERVLQEMKRVLKQNGHLIIGDAWAPAPFRQVANFSFRFGKGGDYKLYSSREMVEMLTRVGFTGVDWQQRSFSSCVVTAQSEP